LEELPPLRHILKDLARIAKNQAAGRIGLGPGRNSGKTALRHSSQREKHPGKKGLETLPSFPYFE